MDDLEYFLVGGAVRDQVLKRENSDRDYVVVGANEEQMLERGFKKIGKSFPVFLHPDTGEEYALARTCLLYTSPSPRDRTRSRMPSSA